MSSCQLTNKCLPHRFLHVGTIKMEKDLKKWRNTPERDCLHFTPHPVYNFVAWIQSKSCKVRQLCLSKQIYRGQTEKAI